MATSITDARYTSLHFTPGHLLSLSFDEPPETGWGVMPGYDEFIPIPAHLEPPRPDADETLPSQIHPSYPFGRPMTKGGGGGRKYGGVTNLLGTAIGQGGDAGGGSDRAGKGERWEELGMREVLEVESRKEVPPGMAGAKRPPSPPSPSLRPSTHPLPRSQHLARLYERQRQATPTAPTDPFDAPVPNETYADEDVQQQLNARDGRATGTIGQGQGREEREGEEGEEGVEE